MMNGSDLRRLREDAGLSLRAVASRAGCSHQLIFLLERGELRLTLERSAAIRAAIEEIVDFRRRLDENAARECGVCVE